MSTHHSGVRVRIPNIWRGLMMTSLAGLGLMACQPVPHLDLTVTTAVDAPDAVPGNGVCEATVGLGDCTFRAAITETNAASSNDIVRIADGVAPTWSSALPPVSDSLDVYGNGTVLHGHVAHTVGVLILRDLTISEVRATSGCGGAITSTGAALSLVSVVVTDNSTAGNHGGGVCATGSLAVVTSTISHNTVTGTTAASGGGIYATGAVTLLSSTVAFNRTSNSTLPNDRQAPGVAMVGPGQLAVTGSTISSNPAEDSPDPQIDAPNAQGSVTRSTLDGALRLSPAVTMSASYVGSCVSGGAPASAGYNYLNGGSCGPPTATDRTGTTRQLSPLADNGGSVETQMPLGASVLLDAIPVGTATLCDGSFPIDARSFSRPAHGGCDIGGVELQSGARIGPTVEVDVVANQGRAEAVNDAGVVVGSGWFVEQPFSLEDHAIAWTNSTRSYLGAAGIRAADINADGHIVGTQGTAGPTHAFRWDPATSVMTDLGTLPGDTASTASGINAAGTVVGYSTSASGVRRAVAWNATTLAITELPRLGGASSEANAVNDAGVAVGSSDRSTGPAHAARWDLSAGTVLDLDTVANGAGSTAKDINAAGTIVGSAVRPDLPDTCADLGYGDSCPSTRPFRWSITGGMEQLPGEVGPLGEATAINDEGFIVEAATTNVMGCSHCPQSVTVGYLFDPHTSEQIELGSSAFGPADISGTGRIVGTGTFVAGPYVFYDHPLSAQLTLLP